jgi:hypothetical protein
MDVYVCAALERIERMTVHLQPAGTKRKLPEPRASPFGSLRTARLREERAERFQAFIKAKLENLRKLDDDEDFSDLDDDDEHEMEQD